MNKTVDERLFEQIMRAPRSIRRMMFNERHGADGPMPGPGGHGCEGSHGQMHGHGPGGPEGGPDFEGGHGPMCEMRGHGPGCPEHGPEVEHGHDPMDCAAPMRGHGPMSGPHPVRGPRPHRHHRGPHPAFAQERLLGVLSNYEDGVRQKELTEEMHVSPSTMSEFISKLEHDGYVKRTVDPDDKRATLITLTEVGEARAAELFDERQERLAKLFAPLTDDEKEQLIALLEKLSNRE